MRVAGERGAAEIRPFGPEPTLRLCQGGYTVKFVLIATGVGARVDSPLRAVPMLNERLGRVVWQIIVADGPGVAGR